MKIDVTTEGYQKRLAFEIPHQQVRNELEQAYKRLSHKVRLPGFRPGKAPRQVLEAKFASQIEADVANDLIQQSYRSALTEHAILPIGQPNLTDSSPVREADGFRFTILVEVRPEITLEVYKDLEVYYPKVEVKAEDVERNVRARLEGQAKLAEVTDRPVQLGDLALTEVVIRDGDDEVVSEPGTMIRTEEDPYLPGIEAFLIGAAIGESKTGKVTFAENARTEAVAGRELDVTAKVVSLQTYKVPELDDEVAKTLGFEGGADGMRSAIEAQLKQGREELARNQARANLLELVIEKNPFDVPSALVEQSLKMLMDELRMQQSLRSGRDPRTIGFSNAQVRDLRIRAQFAAKAGLILEFVSKKEGVEVLDADLDTKYAEMAEERGQTVEAVKGWFQKEDAAAELKDRILEEKTLDWLLERATFTDVAPVAPVAAPPPAEPAIVEAVPTSDDAGFDLSALDGTIDALKSALDAGTFDANLDAVTAGEAARRNRKGALAAIDARRKELSGS